MAPRQKVRVWLFFFSFFSSLFCWLLFVVFFRILLLGFFAQFFVRLIAVATLFFVSYALCIRVDMDSLGLDVVVVAARFFLLVVRFVAVAVDWICRPLWKRIGENLWDVDQSSTGNAGNTFTWDSVNPWSWNELLGYFVYK